MYSSSERIPHGRLGMKGKDKLKTRTQGSNEGHVERNALGALYD